MITFKQFLREWWYGKSEKEFFYIFYDKKDPSHILRTIATNAKDISKTLADVKKQNPSLNIGMIANNYTYIQEYNKYFSHAAFYKTKCPWSIIGGIAIPDQFITDNYQGSKQKYLKAMADNEIQAEKQRQQSNSKKHHLEKQKKLEQELTDHYKYDSKGINDINMYSGGSTTMNKNLHDTMLKGKPSTAHQERVKSLQNTLSQQTTHKDFMVHTGVRRSPELFFPKGNLPNTLLIDMPAFTSTTIMNKNDTSFSYPDWENSNNIFYSESHYGSNLKRKATKDEIEKVRQYVTKGTGAIIPARVVDPKDNGTFVCFYNVIHIRVPAGSHGGYIAKHSQYAEEKEFLFNKDAIIELNTKPEFNMKKFITHWTASLVHDGVKFTKYWRGKV